MATKEQMYNDINEIIDDNRIKSVNGRFYTGENVINFTFDCKYNHLTSDKARDNFFIDNSITSFDYDMFRDDLKYFIEDKYPSIYIDWDNSGFYGRSDGNYCVSFQAGALKDMMRYLFINVKDSYDYKDFVDMYKEITTYDKIVSDVKEFMFKWFTSHLEHIITWSYDNMGFMTLKHPDYEDTVFLHSECDILYFCKDNCINVCELSAGDIGAFNDWNNQYFEEA